ncbi:MAG: hypothetical protein HYR97_04045 [Candidatus Melainabacteria bacterium]|nr:hypothetical protein [Candidatus Melainabacteria bacterium]MBI3307866.1 hypothetical protein [Candidatus Melainabacteria bacterium]
MFTLIIVNHMMSAVGNANPMAKARAATALLNNAQSERDSLETQANAAVQGSPLKEYLLTKLAQASTIISLARMFFEEAIAQQKRDQESIAATNKLAEPARG